MKKVKIMLLASLVVASVGGALAFKAAKGQTLFCGSTSGSGTNHCPTRTVNTYKIANGGSSVSGVFCGTAADTDCTTVTND
jgi:hypothetical protein